MFKAAVFADGGVMNGTADGVNEAIAGAGVGLRILFPRQPLVIRLDYGRGLVGPDTDSHFYAGLSFGF
jgi:hemolysin activation/secretion protein